MMNDTDYPLAIEALKQWFISQEMDPADAGICCLKLIAQQLTEKTTNLAELNKAIEYHQQVLTMEIAACLR